MSVKLSQSIAPPPPPPPDEGGGVVGGGGGVGAVPGPAPLGSPTVIATNAVFETRPMLSFIR
jgi:hypothetical protein